jgi:short-subunit dehydrogenase
MKSLKNKIVWITGASSGIGEALAIVCAHEGARLVLTARREDELARVAGLTGLSEDSILILPADLTDLGQIPNLIERVNIRFGRVDVLFSNAGISSRALALDSPLEIDKKVMDIDYFSVIALAKAVAPGMIGRKEGHIVVTSSVMGKIGTPLRSAYSAAKHALHGFFESFRAEIADTGVKITMLCPGYIHTQVSVNAITPTGGKFNKMSKNQLHGKDPLKFAEVVIRGIKKDKLEIHYGGKETLGPILYRISPKIVNAYLRKQHEKNRFAD